MKFIELYNKRLVNIKTISQIFFEMQDDAYVLRIELNSGKVFDVCEEFSIYFDRRLNDEMSYTEKDMSQIVLFFIKLINTFEESQDLYILNECIYDSMHHELMNIKGIL